MIAKPSKETEALLAALYKPANTVSSNRQDKAATLRLLGEVGGPAAIPEVAPFLFENNQAIAQSAANAIAMLLRLLRAADFRWLDQTMRERSPHRYDLYPSPWAELRPEKLNRLHRLGNNSEFAFGIATLHFKGHVREAALQKLRDVNDGTELPFLLLRLDDWVDEVRDEAIRLVRQRLTREYTSFFVKSLALVLRLKHTFRGSKSEIVQAIETLVKSDAAALQFGLDLAEIGVKRSCYALAFASAQLDQESIIKKGLAESDPIIRLWATNGISSLRDRNSASALLLLTIRDKFPSVRLRALQISLDRYPNLAPALLEAALMDRHRSIRSYAQFLTLKRPDSDLRTFYRTALTRANLINLYAAICGLGEMGSSDDAQLLLPYVRHAIPKIRAAAVRALARLHAQEFVSIFQDGLLDSAPSVSREAKRALSKTLHLIQGETLWNTFAAARESHVQRNALFLLSRLTKWDSIGYLLDALCTENDEVRKLAHSYIRRWYDQFNLSFMSPTATQAERTLSGLMRCGNDLPGSLKKQLMLAIPPGDVRTTR